MEAKLLYSFLSSFFLFRFQQTSCYSAATANFNHCGNYRMETIGKTEIFTPLVHKWIVFESSFVCFMNTLWYIIYYVNEWLNPFFKWIVVKIYFVFFLVFCMAFSHTKRPFTSNKNLKKNSLCLNSPNYWKTCVVWTW